MATTNYFSLGSDPYQDVPKSIGGKQKPVSGRINVFRKSSWLSITRSESMPSIDPLESNTSSSEEFRDEVSSFISEDKTKNKTPSNITPRKASPHRGDHQPINEVIINPFEFNPFWDFEDTGEENKDVKTQARDPPEVAETPYEVLETDKDTQTRSVSAAEKTYHDYQSHVNGPIIVTQPAALRIDQWSKALVRKKNQFKYRSFINEKGVSRKKKSKAKSAVPSVIETVAKYGNGTEQTDYRPKNFTSFESVKMDGVEFRAFDDGPVADDPDLFHRNVRDDSQCREGALIGPLRPNTTLRLTVQERPKDLWDMSEFSERDQPPRDILPLELMSREEQNVAPTNVVTADDKTKSDHKQNKISKNEGQEGKVKDDVVDDTSACPSDGDYSSVSSGKTENLPLLRAWEMKTVDCNNCGSNKARKKLETKKKRAEKKKKLVEDLWERKHFFWKYEYIEDNRKKHFKELDTIVLKIAPEADDTPADVFIEMPLGFQLSTITEGDEDLTACLSPRSMGRSVSLGAGCVQQDGKVLLKTPMESILDSINKDEEVSHSEDEIEIFPHDPQPKDSNIEKNEIPEAKSSKLERPKTSRRSRHRRSAVKLKNNEIEVPDMYDDDSSGGSKGEISDMTEDYLRIPLSSPLYSKVLQAFREVETQNREAETQNGGNKEKVKHYLAHI